MSIEQSGNGDVSISCVASQSVYGGKKQLLTVADISAGKRDKPHRMAVIVNNLQRKLALDCRLLREQVSPTDQQQSQSVTPVSKLYKLPF